MAFDSLLCAALETALNGVIARDVDSQRRLARLKGRCIGVTLQELNRQWIFVFGQRLDVLSHYEGECDCRLSLSLSALPQLQQKANLTGLIKADQLTLEGDIDVAQQFSQLLSGMQFDVAEWLSSYTGDVFAHTVVSQAQQRWLQLQQLAQRQQRYAGDVITEEWRLAPGPLEVAAYSDQVDELRSDAARLDARVTQLVERMESA
ncbi:SCP2 domain-containing protein [Salinivibrio sp. ES.052]|uniref:ubiquinone biosynthesis accessory factor UbiJ n=1 Tax=Salinivibrio sp. ES.052 TaxID=1882823 RepID=UPI000929E258|nr:SCP2 sterol-binding domain-containing protein [Salinivibrio sp. ES.052]SIO21525.1 ubiquinone biosynthesis protein UbiJ [Salinivibrio sp. ES.052]